MRQRNNDEKYVGNISGTITFTDGGMGEKENFVPSAVKQTLEN